MLQGNYDKSVHNVSVMCLRTLFLASTYFGVTQGRTEAFVVAASIPCSISANKFCGNFCICSGGAIMHVVLHNLATTVAKICNHSGAVKQEMKGK